MNITIPRGRYDSLKSFEGTPWFNLVGMHYLTTKYKNSCVIIPFKKNPNDHTDVSIRWVQKNGEDGYLHVPQYFWKEFEKHLEHSHDKRFIIFPFGFSCLKNGGHANYIIYDIKNKILERFDSLGEVNSKCLNAKDVDKKILKLFRDKLGYNFIKKYVRPFTQFKIFQELQDAEDKKKIETDPSYGFCSAWSCWWADLRLSNPDINRDNLIKIAMKELQKEKSLTDFIRNYSQNIINHSIKTQSCFNVKVPEYIPKISKKRQSKKISKKRRSKTISKKRRSKTISKKRRSKKISKKLRSKKRIKSKRNLKKWYYKK